MTFENFEKRQWYRDAVSCIQYGIASDMTLTEMSKHFKNFDIIFQRINTIALPEGVITNEEYDKLYRLYQVLKDREIVNDPCQVEYNYMVAGMEYGVNNNMTLVELTKHYFGKEEEPFEEKFFESYIRKNAMTYFLNGKITLEQFTKLITLYSRLNSIKKLQIPFLYTPPQGNHFILGFRNKPLCGIPEFLIRSVSLPRLYHKSYTTIVIRETLDDGKTRVIKNLNEALESNCKFDFSVDILDEKGGIVKTFFVEDMSDDDNKPEVSFTNPLDYTSGEPIGYTIQFLGKTRL